MTVENGEVEVLDGAVDGADDQTDDNSGDQKPDEKPEGEGDEKPEGDPEPEKKNHQQRRWEKILSENGRLAGELAELRRQQAEKSTPQNQPEAEENNSPTRDQFETDEQYVEALTDFKVGQRLNRVNSELAQKAAIETARKAFVAGEAKLKKTVMDYDEVMQDAQGIRLHQEALDAIFFSPHGPAIRYHLAKTPAEVDRLMSLTPIRAASEIGKIEAQIESRSVKKKISSAPDPIRTLGAGRGSAKVEDDKLSDRQWFEKERKRKQAQ